MKSIDTDILSPKEKQLFDAIAKMHAGTRMYEEGRAEMRKLLGDRTDRAAATTQRIVALRTARRGRRRSRIDKGTLDAVFAGIKNDRWATTLSISKRTHITAYTVDRAIEQLKKTKRIEASFRKGNPSHTDARTKGRTYRYWQVTA